MATYAQLKIVETIFLIMFICPNWFQDGQLLDRISPWTSYALQPDGSFTYDHVIWNPTDVYQFKHKSPPVPENLKIYEAHVGIASPEPKVSSYKHFTAKVLPHIADMGYNCIQLMAIMEHAYYGCFGYQVTYIFHILAVFQLRSNRHPSSDYKKKM